MSVLIKGMKMPTSCPICVVIDAAGQARRYDLNNDRYVDNELFESVSVPKHGRCIDADALMELYADTDDLRLKDMKVPIAVIRQNIMDMPTIIPADPPKEET